MVKQYKLYHNQSLIDGVIEQTGSLDAVFAIALTNNVSITDNLPAGTSFFMDETTAIDETTVNYFAAKKIKPATSLNDFDLTLLDQGLGIGSMAIGSTFKVY